MPASRFLESYYSGASAPLEDTRFFDHFGDENIPFGIASDSSNLPSVTTRHNDLVLFLAELAEEGYLSGIASTTIATLKEGTLNSFAALDKAERNGVREAIQGFIHTCPKCPKDSCELRECMSGSKAICHISKSTLHLPFSIGDFTDFSCSENHVLNASEVMTGKRGTPPAFYNYPIGYAGRTSSIVVSGSPITRPRGLYRDGRGADIPLLYQPTNKLDFELEVAAFIGKASELGTPVKLGRAEDHIFGLVLVNDWSARDIQGLEMVPLGPLNGKSFCTTISPWVVTLEALAAFKQSAPKKEKSASYLSNDPPVETYNIELSAEFLPCKVGGQNDRGSSNMEKLLPVCTSNLTSLYWTLIDLVAHQTANGCNLNVGDLLATGTISGSTPESRGCLMESPSGVECGLDNEERLHFLGDGDTILLTGKAGEGVGFGDCWGKIQEACSFSN